MKKLLIFILFYVAVSQAQVAGATGYTGNSAGAGGFATAGEPSLMSAPSVGIRSPLFFGAALGFGSGTGVGSERGLGLRQIEPMIGVWYPRLGFIRLGYGFFDYREEAEDKDSYEIDHSDFDVELGLHIFGELFLMGSYSRVKELSDLGDVAWNEWGAGFGSIMNIFYKCVLFAEVGYRWVLDHYDPFLQKNVNGSRLQFNIGFATYVF